MFRELVRLLKKCAPAEEATTVERARTAVTLADDLRRRDPMAAGEDTGVPDPFGRSWKVQREIAVQVRDLSLDLSEHVFGVASSGILLPVPERIRRRRRWRWRRNRLLR